MRPHEAGHAEVTVEQQRLVEGAQRGDHAAFTALAHRYHAMALGYALALLGDYQLAQDATQEALLAAYRGLPALEDAARFPAWFRGIVRFQCSHVRRRRFDVAPLDEGGDLPSTALGPEQQVEVREGFQRVLTAIGALPPAQREVALLFYIQDYAHREIAAFLDLPLATVNNRLHAARTALRGRLRMQERHGRVSAIQDVVVDVAFAPEEMPVLLSGLRVGADGAAAAPTLQVVQHVRDGLVRCVVHGDSTALQPGASVVHAGEPLLRPLDADLVTRVLTILTGAEPGRGGSDRPDHAPPVLLETGIKVLDLLCPLPTGGTVGIVGPTGTGRLVISAEILHNTAHQRRGVTLVAFLNGELEGRALYDAPEDAPRPTGTSRIVVLPLDTAMDRTAPAALAAAPFLDAQLVLSYTLAKEGIWPAIDPLWSTSRLMDRAILGPEQYRVARAVRDLLHRQRDLLEGAPDGRTHDLTATERRLISRARKVQRYCSQPFAVAAPFTGRPGQVVPLAEAIHAYEELVSGQYDALPDEAFLWRGGLDSLQEAAG